MDHVEAERVFASLKAQLDAGRISQEQFMTGVNNLRYQDYNGEWWAISPWDGQWLHWNGTTWESFPHPRTQQDPPSPGIQAVLAESPQMPRGDVPSPSLQSSPEYAPTSIGETRSQVGSKWNWVAIASLGSVLLSFATHPYIFSFSGIGIGAYSLFSGWKHSGKIEYVAVAGIAIGVFSALWNYYYMDIFAMENLPV
jgi:hypothetical protein